MLAALLPVLAPIFGKVVGNLFPDKEAAAKAEAEMMRQLLAHQNEIESAAAGIIRQEAASSHWLAANWRPITMLTFLGLIVARWFGWAAPDLADAEYLKLWDIVELGLGGYVIGRSVEKVGPAMVSAFRQK